MEIRSADGVVVSEVEGVFPLEEATTYHIQMAPGMETLSAKLGPRELPWHEEHRIFTLEIGHWIGSAQLHILQGAHETAIPIEVGPRPEKLSEGAWLALLNDLEAWSPGASVGFAGGGVGVVHNEGTTAPILAAALLPLVPALIRAIRTIAASPRELTISLREDRPFRTIRKADRETLHWLTRHPIAAQALNPWSGDRSHVDAAHVPQRMAHDTVAHPVNRYVAWILHRIARDLRELSCALERMAKNSKMLPDTASWCRARAHVAALSSDELSRLLRQTFFARLSPMPATEAALLAVQDDPAYARAYALARPFLAPRFQLRESLDETEAPVRPSFELYELWTFLAVQQSFAKVLDGWKWNWHPTAGNELLAGIGNGSFFEARREDGAKFGIHYNLTFPGYLAKGKSDRYSISGERRPDIVISFEAPNQRVSWVCLDAKYRVRRDALAESFTSLHVYRDSLRWEHFGGSCRGGLLLVPAIVSECEPWFADDYRMRFGIGAFRLTPGEGDAGTIARLVETMVRNSSEPMFHVAEDNPATQLNARV